MTKRKKQSQDGSTANLRWYIGHLVRIWTALGTIRRVSNNEPAQAFQDACSNTLRIMLYELATRKRGSMGFSPEGSDKHKRLYAQLLTANKWFTGRNKLHARNCSGAHLQPLDDNQHMFQQFGYGGNREWKKLTHGVAACLGMMKLIDSGKHKRWWRELREKVRAGKMEEWKGRSVPASIGALLIGGMADEGN